MKKKYTNAELEDAVEEFWDTYCNLKADGMKGYGATSVAFDAFKEKLGWKWGKGDRDGDENNS